MIGVNDRKYPTTVDGVQVKSYGAWKNMLKRCYNFDFQKKYGIDKAKELVSSIINTISVNGYVCDPCFITDEGEHISYNDLKRHIDSYEMVESCGR